MLAVRTGTHEWALSLRLVGRVVLHQHRHPGGMICPFCVPMTSSEKNVKMWEIQMMPYAPKNDQTLMLYKSFSGDTEQDLEHVANHEDGINVLLQKLHVQFQQRAMFQKVFFFT